MANIKSQIKRNRQNAKRRLRNRHFRGAARTAVNDARLAFESSAPNTKDAVMAAISALDKAAEKGVLHPNNASRRKSRLMRRLYALNAPARPAAERPMPADSPIGSAASSMEEPAGKKGAKKAVAKAPAAKKPAAKKAAAKAPAKKKTTKK